MKITSIRLENYRMHERMSVDFKAGFNVIVGVNGSGKTSLLKGVFEALNVLGQALPGVPAFPGLYEPGVARVKKSIVNGRVRFESQYPVVVSVAATAFGEEVGWALSRNGEVGQPTVLGKTPGVVLHALEPNKSSVDLSSTKLALPLIAFYRSNRQWNHTSPTEIQAATERTSRLSAYANWGDASVDASAFLGWVIAKCLERFQTSSETGRPFDAIDDDELALVNRALGVAVEGFAGMRYDLKQKSLLIEWRPDSAQAGNATSFDNLSDGQRAVIGLVADIARRMCLLNPVLGDEVIERTSGVVLIDELDMHLHPHWQRILTNGLKRAFPALQFIVASHSPQVIGELHPDEIILLRPGGTAHPQVSYGLTSSQILEEVMGAEARNVDVEKRLEILFEALERNQLDKAQQALIDLRETVPGLPELAGAEALLKRKQVLGR